MAAAQERLDARSHKLNLLGALVVNNLEAYLKSLADDAVLTVHAPASLVRLQKGETAASAVDRLRAQVAGFKADLLAVGAAPITSARAKAIARTQVEQLAQRGQPDCFGTIEHAEAVRWPQRRTGTGSVSEVILSNGERAPVISRLPEAVPDAMAVLAWLHKDALIAALDAEIDASADDKAALDDDTRSQRAAEIAAAILLAEREECTLVEIMNGAVLFRSDSDARAVLAMDGPAPRAP